MPEQLLKVKEAAKLLGVSRNGYYEYRAMFIANGLQEVMFGKKGRRIRAASIDVCIKAMAENENFRDKK